MPNQMQRLKRPLFLKLTLVFVLTSLVLVSLVAAFFQVSLPHNRRGHDNMRKNWAYHFQNLAERIGTPPNEKKAQAVSKELGFEIAAQGPGLAWSTRPSSLPLKNFDEAGQEDIQGVKHGRVDNTFFWLVHKGPYQYLFWSSADPLPEIPVERVLVLLGLILFILFLSYLTVSVLINPLRLLLDGVEHVKAGDLDYRVSVRDRHEFKSLADSFNQMTGKVREMVKARERLMIDVSHELRGPLTRIKVALEMIPKSSKRESVRAAAAEMELMLAELLESQKLRSSHGGLVKKEENLAALVKRVCANFKGQKPGLRIKAGPRRLAALIDERRMEIAVKNVVENALKYSQNQARPVEIGFETAGGEIRVLVRDHGVGIPKEDLELVFEPFYRVDKSRARKTGGYGLGLSLCREILLAHGGDVRITSQEGGGTTVALVLKSS